MTEPKYFFTKSGYFCIASDIEQKIIPFLVSSSLYVVATETLSQILHPQLLHLIFFVL